MDDISELLAIAKRLDHQRREPSSETIECKVHCHVCHGIMTLKRGDFSARDWRFIHYHGWGHQQCADAQAD